MIDRDKSRRNEDANPDPITGAPGAHPVGVGVGAATGGAAGAAVGAAGGPVGAALGATVGAVAGGLAGKAAAESVNPTAEAAYWESNYHSEPYYEQGRAYSDYAPGYRVGYEGYSKYSGRKTFDEVDRDLERDYQHVRGASALTWNRARNAARAAWHRLERIIPGDADREGR